VEEGGRGRTKERGQGQVKKNRTEVKHWGGSLSALPTDAACQLDVFGHDGDTLGMDGTQVSVLKQTHQVRLTGLLQGTNGSALETQVSLEVLSDFPHQALEGQLTDQQLSGLLVPTDLTQGHCSWPVAMGLLDPPSGRSTLAGSLGGQLLSRSFASSGFTGSLLGTGHDFWKSDMLKVSLKGGGNIQLA